MNDKTDIEIRPLVGANALSFGMSAAEVEQLAGPPDSSSINHLGQLVEFRSFMNIGYSQDASRRLVHFGFGRQMEGVRLGTNHLFIMDPFDALRGLRDMGAHPLAYLGFIVFPELGLALTGFHDGDVSQKAISLFEYGAWDSRIPKMTPFRI